MGAGVMLAARRADTDIVNVVATHPHVRLALTPRVLHVADVAAMQMLLLYLNA